MHSSRTLVTRPIPKQNVNPLASMRGFYVHMIMKARCTCLLDDQKRSSRHHSAFSNTLLPYCRLIAMTVLKKNTNGQLRLIQAKIADVNYSELLDTLSKYVKICFQPRVRLRHCQITCGLLLGLQASFLIGYRSKHTSQILLNTSYRHSWA